MLIMSGTCDSHACGANVLATNSIGPRLTVVVRSRTTRRAPFFGSQEVRNTVIRLDQMEPRAREKLAIILVSVLLLGWLAVCTAIQIRQIIHHGYGSGITNRGHLPDEVRDYYDVGPDVSKEELMEMTNK